MTSNSIGVLRTNDKQNPPKESLGQIKKKTIPHPENRGRQCGTKHFQRVSYFHYLNFGLGIYLSKGLLWSFL